MYAKNSVLLHLRKITRSPLILGPTGSTGYLDKVEIEFSAVVRIFFWQTPSCHRSRAVCKLKLGEWNFCGESFCVIKKNWTHYIAPNGAESQRSIPRKRNTCYFSDFLLYFCVNWNSVNCNLHFWQKSKLTLAARYGGQERSETCLGLVFATQERKHHARLLLNGLLTETLVL